MALVTTNFRVDRQPLRRAFVEHVGPAGIGSLGWGLTDNNGSVTFDAGLFADRVDVKLYCQNSVVRVLDGAFLTTPVYQLFNVGNGDTVTVSRQKDHYRILNRCMDLYETVWRQFWPYNGRSRRDFPLGRKTGVRATFSSSQRIELSYPDQFVSDVAFVEPSGLNNSGFPLAHIKARTRDGRLFGERDTVAPRHDPSILPHELGHIFHFSALLPTTRVSIETDYLGFILSHLPDASHDVARPTTSLVAFIEAVGIFSERLWFFSKRVEPNLTGTNLHRAFIDDELGSQRLRTILVDPYTSVGTLNRAGNISAQLTGDNVEGSVYGAIFLDLASRIGLKETVGLVLQSNATNFNDFRSYINGRGNNEWRDAIRAVASTWRIRS